MFVSVREVPLPPRFMTTPCRGVVVIGGWVDGGEYSANRRTE